MLGVFRKHKPLMLIPFVLVIGTTMLLWNHPLGQTEASTDTWTRQDQLADQKWLAQAEASQMKIASSAQRLAAQAPVLPEQGPAIPIPDEEACHHAQHRLALATEDMLLAESGDGTASQSLKLARKAQMQAVREVNRVCDSQGPGALPDTIPFSDPATTPAATTSVAGGTTTGAGGSVAAFGGDQELAEAVPVY